MYPSALEARLIIWMLGPLAVAEAGLYFCNFASLENIKLRDLADSINNICDSSLALLYMAALIVWGTLVNWRRAWRIDGATALFGGLALLFAFLKTMISFVHIAYDRIYWLRKFSWSFNVWQSWVGFWWWVSAGMGIGEYEDRIRAEEQARTRSMRRKRLKLREGLRRHGSKKPESVEMDAIAGAAGRPATTDDRSTDTPASPAHVSEWGDSLDSTMSDSELPLTARIGRVLSAHQPDFIRRRLNHLRAAHRRAINQAVMWQAEAYVRVIDSSRSPVAAISRGLVRSDERTRRSVARFRLQDRTVYD